jgi:hypothetical protein
VRTITYPDGSFEQFEFEDHRLVATTDRESRWTRHMYNPLMLMALGTDSDLTEKSKSSFDVAPELSAETLVIDVCHRKLRRPPTVAV